MDFDEFIAEEEELIEDLEVYSDKVEQMEERLEMIDEDPYRGFLKVADAFSYINWFNQKHHKEGDAGIGSSEVDWEDYYKERGFGEGFNGFDDLEGPHSSSTGFREDTGESQKRTEYFVGSSLSLEDLMGICDEFMNYGARKGSSYEK